MSRLVTERPDRRWLSRWWPYLAIFAVLGIGIGMFRHRHLGPGLKLVGRYPSGRAQWVTLDAHTAGFIDPDGPSGGGLTMPRIVQLYGWSGRPLWRVTIPGGDVSGWGNVEWREHSVGISPDGRTVAAALPDGPGRLLILTWHDGAPAGRALVRTGTRNVGRIGSWPRLVAKDDRTVIVCPRWDAVSALIVARGDRLIATGRYASGLRPRPLGDGMSDMLHLQVSPDGSALMGWLSADGDGTGTYPTFEYSTLAIAGGRVHVNRVYAVSVSKDHVRILRGDVAVTRGGTVYSKTGVSPGLELLPTSWGRGPEWETWVLRRGHGLYRLCAPGLGISWEIPCEAELRNASCSRDGRYVVALEVGNPKPQASASRFTQLPEWLTGNRSTPSSDEAGQLVIYERPGRARLRIPVHSEWTDPYRPDTSHVKPWFTVDGQPFYFNSFLLSPDGHRLIMRGHVKGSPEWEFLVFAW